MTRLLLLIAATALAVLVRPAIAEHFDIIDSARAGRVTFEDYKRFLRAQGARTL